MSRLFSKGRLREVCQYSCIYLLKVPIKTLSPNTPPADSYWTRETLDALVDLVRKVHGLDLFPFDRTFLAKALDRRAAAFAETSLAYEERLARDSSEGEALLRSLHIGYSEFFRNILAFALLEQVILPSLIDTREKSGRGELRIWSAGCAAGQEAWSLAILLDALNRVTGILRFRIVLLPPTDSRPTWSRPVPVFIPRRPSETCVCSICADIFPGREDPFASSPD